MKEMIYNIIVDCEKNDPVDYRCGGPYILGFDFFVTDENKNEILDFVKEMLIKYKRPIMDIRVTEKRADEYVGQETIEYWSKKEKIEKCIKEGY